MSRIVNLMLALIKSEITETSLDIAEFAPITEKDLKLLYALSSKHTLDHIVGYALKKNHLLADDEFSKQFQKKLLISAFQYEKMTATLQQLSEVFNAEKISFIPLKGSRIRQYYPEPFLRNSCDIDILIHEEELNRAVRVLHEQLGYTIGEKGYHDISLFSKNGVHLELHFNIQENMDNIDNLLKQVWKFSHPVSEGVFEYQQNDAYFVFHNIAHIAYHFTNGGCGIRMFMDIYVLRKALNYDEKSVEDFCSQCGILEFYHHILDLISVWFENKEHTKTTKKMQDYILQSGIFGTRENSIAVQQSKSGSKVKYILQRIFMPYRDLKILYPKLEKYKWLLPFYEVCRWCRTIWKGRLKSSVDGLKVSGKMEDSKAKEIQEILEEVGL